MPISPWATYTPTKQPAGTPDEWISLDLSTYDGSTWIDFIQDVDGETWKRTRLNSEDRPPWHAVELDPRHTVKGIETSEYHWFLTIDWCKQGKRGLFTDLNGKGYWLSVPYTLYEMHQILGVFWMVLSPECLPFTEAEISTVSEWYPLEEYSGQFGYALIPEAILATITERVARLAKEA